MDKAAKFEQQFMSEMRTKLNASEKDYFETFFSITVLIQEIHDMPEIDGFSKSDLCVLLFNAAWCEWFNEDQRRMTKGSHIGLIMHSAASAMAEAFADEVLGDNDCTYGGLTDMPGYA